jgi:hypothetical protein
LKQAWVSNLFRGSWRSEHFKENIENRREEPKAHEKKAGEPARATDARLSSSVLKRKRPTRLDIPELARLASFGKAKQFELPAQEASSPQIVSNENEVYGVCAKKGRKEYMEDTYLAVTDFQGKPGQVSQFSSMPAFPSISFLLMCLHYALDSSSSFEFLHEFGGPSLS